ncbi:hypothetical protein FA13DRAFT_1330673 [Coprinellus micaceus]|uniref:Uncharacterized protein n=1 Tax=Coprinellus micaceus TaxID=71717 RepID=A0A4Y7SR98_COPMI|nr:hypothetical protein FA13DRAFT_1330673 [Coprinellus micaceus]
MNFMTTWTLIWMKDRTASANVHIGICSVIPLEGYYVVIRIPCRITPSPKPSLTMVVPGSCRPSFYFW